MMYVFVIFFFFSSRRRHTRYWRDWSSDVCSSDLPDRTVVLFDGDGSLMMHVQELETIKRHRLNILIVVMNDGAYGSELHKLRSEGMPEDGSVFGYCDFAGIARGFGLPGKTFKNLDDLPRLVAEFAASGGAAVWDFHVSDKVVSPTIRRAHPHPPKEKRG